MTERSVLESSTLPFRKSTYSQINNNNCVEVADLPTGAAVRDSQHPENGHLAFGAGEWTAFLRSARTGEL
ncbi:DUF397 domain-containing protein [Spiractinospora alimapuensis]|uniref:DUF397 domain-containing protein n=1 Tax=Spiractinospora alimapuensis TaxID=2820884 RepID=UPI001F2B2818|nr:DUF397 domain-containing protein [Spiractinospora alimapuensis]QVQ51227.1 DUF397 domain-containing protein [Spiractinospora alimapuensis]